MNEVDCIRCHQKGNAIEGPFPAGKLWDTIRLQICNLCWKEWQAQSVKIINEYRLNLREPSAREVLSTQMKIFFNMATPSSNGSTAVPIQILDV